MAGTCWIAISMLIGKMSWGMGLLFALSLGVLFGAPSLVGLLTGQEGEVSCEQFSG